MIVDTCDSGEACPHYWLRLDAEPSRKGDALSRPRAAVSEDVLAIAAEIVRKYNSMNFVQLTMGYDTGEVVALARELLRLAGGETMTTRTLRVRLTPQQLIRVVRRVLAEVRNSAHAAARKKGRK